MVTYTKEKLLLIGKEYYRHYDSRFYGYGLGKNSLIFHYASEKQDFELEETVKNQILKEYPDINVELLYSSQPPQLN
jgi:hypothetical protein